MGPRQRSACMHRSVMKLRMSGLWRDYFVRAVMRNGSALLQCCRQPPFNTAFVYLCGPLSIELQDACTVGCSLASLHTCCRCILLATFKQNQTRVAPHVPQGAQVANPWNPGQAAGASGVPTSPPGAAAGIASNPAATTEAGAAAVATVTGFAHLPAVQEAADGAGNASNELLNMLGMSAAEAGQCGGGSAGGGEGMYLSR